MEVCDQVRTDGSEDVDTRRDGRVHLTVHERGMEVPGVERHQANVSHEGIGACTKGRGSD
jgi:hypothetical protein